MRYLPVKLGLPVTLPRDVTAPGMSIDAMGTVVGQMRSAKGIQFTLSTPAQQSIRKYIAEVDKD
jgi:hypothetical protein